MEADVVLLSEAEEAEYSFAASEGAIELRSEPLPCGQAETP